MTEEQRNRPEWDRIIREPEARKLAGDPSRTTVHRWEKAGIWPKAIRVGPNMKGFWLSEILAMLEARRAQNDFTTTKPGK